MVENAIPIFYEGEGKIRTVTHMTDATLPVKSNKYWREQQVCTFYSTCYLDDPYEGEMFAVMMDLLSPFSNATEGDNIWAIKRGKL